MSALDPRADRDPAEAQRLLEDQLAQQRVQEWRDSYTAAFEQILDDADEHNLDADDVRDLWQAALKEHLADQEPPSCACGSGMPAGQCGCDYGPPSAAERREKEIAEHERLKR